jgi:hypothetical protein
MKKTKTITVYSELMELEAYKSYKSDESRLQQFRSPIANLPLTKVKKSIADFSEVMSEILASMPQKKEGFQLDEIRIHTLMNIDGDIQFLGAKLGALVEGGIEFVWKKS